MTHALLCLLGCLALARVGGAQTPVNVLTYHNDNGRTGQNLNEVRLTPANVNATAFGKLHSFPVDGEIYGQPLYMSQVRFADQSARNLVFVATEHDSVYAFDADNQTDGLPLWHASFIDPAAGVTPMDVLDLGISDPATPEIGITSTPVIDPATQTLYVVAKTKETSATTTQYYFRLHALDIRTGAEKFGGPAVIDGSVPGSGEPNDGLNHVLFQPLMEHQRAALLLLNGVIYVTWASIGDLDPYHGWVMGYDAHTLQQVAIFNDTPNGFEGGIWQAGAGPSADPDGNFYVATGNGTFDYNAGPDYGDSVLKLALTNSALTVVDYFTPADQDELTANDLDLGSGGVLVVPDQNDTPLHLLIQTGKEGTIYVLNRDHLGHYQAGSNSQLIQSLPTVMGGSFGAAAYFNQRVYYCGMRDFLKAYTLRGGLLSTQPTSISAHQFGYGGSTPSLSANGGTNGIIWALDNGGFATFSPAVLHAYDATDLGAELYNSAQSGDRDAAGPAVRFTVPTVANGKVFVGTANELTVYGPILSVGRPTLTPAGGSFTNQITVTLSVTTPNAQIHYTLDGSPPSVSSPLYAGSLTLSATTVIKAQAFVTGAIASEVVSATYFSAADAGDGSGLLAEYYSAGTLAFADPPTLDRVDAGVNFTWNGAAPDPSLSSGSFSVRWSGQILARFSETYTFYALASGGVRLTLDDQPVIDDWLDQPYTEASGTVALTAGQRYDLTLEYFSGSGSNAVAQLLWSSPSTPKMIIPVNQLYPATNGLPWITLQPPPDGTTLAAPATFSLSANVSDNAAFSRVTFYAGATLLGAATNAPFALTVSNLTTGTYALSARASDLYGTIFLAPTISLTVGQTAPIVITEQPQSQVAASGSTVTLEVQTTAAGGINYQWQHDGAPLAGATNASLVLADVQPADAGAYSVMVSNPVSAVTSASVELTVTDPARIISSPTNLVVIAGAPASFNAVAAGTGPLAYQWQFNGANLPGATNASLFIADAQPALAGLYAVVVSNSFGAATSAAAQLTVNVPVTISGQPQAQTVLAGAPASFTVTASGTGPLSYQWLFNGSDLAGATNATLFIAAAQPADAGAYSALVSNPAGVARSAAAALTVNQPIVITNQPLSQVAAFGATVTLQVGVSGTAPLTFQWWKDQEPVAGATNATLMLSNLHISDAGNYFVVVTNPVGSVTSAAAALFVTPPTEAPPSIAAASLNWSDGGFQLVIFGTPGATYLVQYSSDLERWTDLTTVVSTDGSARVVDDHATDGARFYRALLK